MSFFSLLFFFPLSLFKPVVHSLSLQEHEQNAPAKKAAKASKLEFVMPDPLPRLSHVAPWGTSQPAPVFRPTVEQFQDPLSFIASVASVGKRFGICKIIPPTNSSDWKSPSTGLPSTINSDKLSFRTKVQMIHRLKHRASRAEVFHRVYQEWKESRTELRHADDEPCIDGLIIDLWDLLRAVWKRFGPLESGRDRLGIASDPGWLDVLNDYMSLSVLSGSAMARLWGARIDCAGDSRREGEFAVRAAKLRGIYFLHLHAYEQEATSARRHQMWDGISEEEIVDFGYGTGPTQTLTEFRAKAAEFKHKYFLDDCSEDELERLYWRAVESAESRVEVEYGNDLSVVQYGSGFTADPNDPMSRQPWNLNVMPKVRGEKEFVPGFDVLRFVLFSCRLLCFITRARLFTE